MAIVVEAATSTLSNLFLYCYFGMLATQSYEEMSDYLYFDSYWFALPSKLQKYPIIMITNMQKPLYYHGFEVAPLNLRTFILVRDANRFSLII